MPDGDRERLQSIKTFPHLVKYLRDELDWPIETEDFEDLTFDYEPEELGIDPDTAAKIEEIKQLRPLVTNQPWGIFFAKFEPRPCANSEPTYFMALGSVNQHREGVLACRQGAFDNMD